MINCATKGYSKKHLEVEDIKALEILEDLNIKKEPKSRTLSAEEANKLRPKRPKTDIANLNIRALHFDRPLWVSSSFSATV